MTAQTAAPPGTYPYLEEVNDGILRQFRRLRGAPGIALDVGCGRGVLAEAVRCLGWRVWGVERHPEACEAARGRLDRLIEEDLEDYGAVGRQLAGESFDALIFSDVLEHLCDPLGVLKFYLSFVRPGGWLFVSVPNLVVWTNRLRLLLGYVDQADSGVMDRTHVRLFSFRTARELVRAAGCVVERTGSTPHLARAFLPLIKRVLFPEGGPPGPRALIESKPYKFYLKYVYPAEHALASLWRTMLAFRIVVAARKSPEEGPTHHGY
jgi:SAM-dependent methyltransferase